MKIEKIMNVYYFKEDIRNVTEMYFNVMTTILLSWKAANGVLRVVYLKVLA